MVDDVLTDVRHNRCEKVSTVAVVASKRFIAIEQVHGNLVGVDGWLAIGYRGIVQSCRWNRGHAKGARFCDKDADIHVAGVSSSTRDIVDEIDPPACQGKSFSTPSPVRQSFTNKGPII